MTKLAPEEGERRHFGFRVTPEMKAHIETAAKASGRSMSQEVEFRLEQTKARLELLPDVLRLQFGELGGIVLLIAFAMDRNGRHAAWATSNGDADSVQGDAWLSSATAFDSAAKAAMRTLEAFRPKGRVEPCGPLPDTDALLSTELTGRERAPPPSTQDIWRMFRPETIKRVKANLGGRTRS